MVDDRSRVATAGKTWHKVLTVGYESMQATLCVCQALFMMAQYPKIGWEPIYMPLCEAANYGLGWAGYSTFILADGRY